jgi:hypothetical protein
MKKTARPLEWSRLSGNSSSEDLTHKTSSRRAASRSNIKGEVVTYAARARARKTKSLDVGLSTNVAVMTLCGVIILVDFRRSGRPALLGMSDDAAHHRSKTQGENRQSFGKASGSSQQSASARAGSQGQSHPIYPSAALSAGWLPGAGARRDPLGSAGLCVVGGVGA